MANRLVNSHLSVKHPLTIVICPDSSLIRIAGENRKCEKRSFPNMRFKHQWQCSEETLIKMLSRQHQGQTKKGNFVLKNGKVNIHLHNNHESEGKLYSLLTPEPVTIFCASRDGKIVTHGKNGIRTWELQERENLDTIMRPQPSLINTLFLKAKAYLTAHEY